MVYNNMKSYGYARVSTKKQSIQSQKAIFDQYRVPEENRYYDIGVSGNSKSKPEFQRMLHDIRHESSPVILYIRELTRLDRSYDGLIESIESLQQEDVTIYNCSSIEQKQGLQIIEPTYNCRLSEPLKKIAYYSEMELAHNRERQQAAIAVAKKSDIKWGRPKKNINLQNYLPFIEKLKKKEISVNDFCKALECSRTYFYNTVMPAMKELGVIG